MFLFLKQLIDSNSQKNLNKQEHPIGVYTITFAFLFAVKIALSFWEYESESDIVGGGIHTTNTGWLTVTIF